MKFKFIILAAYLYFSFLYSAYSHIIPKDPAIRTGKLANGLTYIIRKNQTPKGQADFYLVQKVGSVLEDENQRGLAHFLEHMAFNGTKHFPGNTMISELEKKGIKFGANINAYTAYDETVYRLTNIPMSREGILDTALLVMHDWSGFILNEDKDIDEERAVIREEWRTRSNAYSRVQENEIIPRLLKGTAYANRLPIGSMDIVMNFKYKQLKDYYQKWYRPDLQGLIIVGDIDVDQVEVKIKTLFGAIARRDSVSPLPDINIPDSKKAVIAIASDPEITNTSATVYWRQQPYSSKMRSSPEYYKMKILENIISNLINQRFSDLKGKNRTWSSSTLMGEYSVAKKIPAWTLNLNVLDNNIISALKSDLLEIERIRRYGFSRNELDPAIRQSHLLSNESTYFDQDQIDNLSLGDGLKKQFLNGEILPESTWKYEMTKKVLKEMTVESLNNLIKEYLSHVKPAVVILQPGKRPVISDDKEIINILKEIKVAKLEVYKKEIKPDDFVNLVVPKEGKIRNEQLSVPPLGFTKWEMSNGVKVWFKNTGYRESKVKIFGVKPGGYSQISLENLPAAIAYNGVLRNASGLVGAIGVNVATQLDSYFSSIAVSGRTMNLETMFKSLYLRMTKLKDEPKTFEEWKFNRSELIKLSGTIPKEAFGDTLRSLFNNRHPRAISLKKLDVLNQVTYQKIKDLHKEFFGNAKGYEFVIVGNLNVDTVKHLTETWLGGLPVRSDNFSGIVDHNMYPPKGIVKKQFSKVMETPQSSVTLAYTGEIEHTFMNRILISNLADILEKRYVTEIREKEGGSYGVGVSGDLFALPTDRFIFQVYFDTAPDEIKRKKLIDIIYREIEDIKLNGPTPAEMEMVLQANIKDAKENNSKKNTDYWFNRQGFYIQYGKDFDRDMEEVVNAIDTVKIRKLAKKIFSEGNIIEVVMNPGSN